MCLKYKKVYVMANFKTCHNHGASCSQLNSLLKFREPEILFHWDPQLGNGHDNFRTGSNSLLQKYQVLSWQNLFSLGFLRLDRKCKLMHEGNMVFMCNLLYLNGKAIGHYRCIQGEQVVTILLEGSLDISYKIFIWEWGLVSRAE